MFTGPPLGGALCKICSVMGVFEQLRVENMRGPFGSNWSNWLKTGPDDLKLVLEEPINLLITKELMFINGMLNNQVDIIA